MKDEKQRKFKKARKFKKSIIYFQESFFLGILVVLFFKKHNLHYFLMEFCQFIKELEKNHGEATNELEEKKILN